MGPWAVVDGEMVKMGGSNGISKWLPHLGDAGRGINRKLPHLGNAGQGINRKLPHLGNAGQGVKRSNEILGYLTELAERMRMVRICCGEWVRVCGPSITFKHGLTGVFLDPPYSAEACRAEGIYASDSLSVAHEVREWAVANGDNPFMRIVLCGYEDEHDMPDDWEVIEWSANGGYDAQRKKGKNDNKHRERLWLSPHCLKERMLWSLIDG